MKRWLAALALALLSPAAFAAYDFEKIITGTSGVDFDTRCFPAFLILPYPLLTNLNGGENYPAEHWRFYAAAGDKNVVASRVCGNVAPTWAVTGTPPDNDTLTTTDLNDPTWSITGMVAGSASMNAVADNSVGAALTTPRSWTITGGGTSAEVIPQNARAVFVAAAPAGNDSNDGRSCSTPVASVTAAKAKTTLAGDDVYFRAGDTWDGAWSMAMTGGASEVADRQIVGGYYCLNAAGQFANSGTAYVNAPTNWTASRRPSSYTYAYPRPRFTGSYLQTCRLFENGSQTQSNGLPVSGKCAWDTNAFKNYTTAYNGASCKDKTPDSARVACANALVHGNYGPSGSPAVPPVQTAALLGFTFAANKKWVTFQDFEVYGSAGKGIVISAGVTCYGATDTTCQIESIAQRLHIHHNAHSSLDSNGAARVVLRENYIHDSGLRVADRQFGNQRGGGALAVFNCAHCQILVEGNDMRDVNSESYTSYFVSHVLFRGNIAAKHSISGGQTSDFIYEQNLIFGTTPVKTLPSTYALFPFWSLINENNGAGQGGPVWNNVDTRPVDSQIVRRNNVAVSAHTWTFGYSAFRTNGDGPFFNVNASGWDIGNTIIVGDQDGPIGWVFRDLHQDSSKPANDPANCDEVGEDHSQNAADVANGLVWGCRTRGVNESFLNKWKVQDNLFIVQPGYTPSTALGWCYFTKAAGGTLTMGPNFFNVDPTNNGCQTNKVVNATSGLPTVDWIGQEFEGNASGAASTAYPNTQVPSIMLDAANFRPAAGSAAVSGTALTATDGMIDSGTEWDWVLDQRLWLPPCNTAGMMAKANWLKQLYGDFCDNVRAATPTNGAFEHAP